MEIPILRTRTVKRESYRVRQDVPTGRYHKKKKIACTVWFGYFFVLLWIKLHSCHVCFHLRLPYAYIAITQCCLSVSKGEIVFLQFSVNWIAVSAQLINKCVVCAHCLAPFATRQTINMFIKEETNTFDAFTKAP